MNIDIDLSYYVLWRNIEHYRGPYNENILRKINMECCWMFNSVQLDHELIIKYFNLDCILYIEL